MTESRSMPSPPRWAESLLRMLLPPKSRDSISGDLLEEYRESIVPAMGSRADGWYIRQVARYVVRQTWVWGALIGGILVTRYLVDSLAPVHYTSGIIATRSKITSYALMATFALCAAWQTWRSERLRTGVLMAVATAVLGAVASSAGALICLAVWHDPDTLLAAQQGGGLGEALWGVPLLLIPIGFITGTTGAIAGRLARAAMR
jgi:hypothetical protein